MIYVEIPRNTLANLVPGSPESVLQFRMLSLGAKINESTNDLVIYSDVTGEIKKTLSPGTFLLAASLGAVIRNAEFFFKFPETQLNDIVPLPAYQEYTYVDPMTNEEVIIPAVTWANVLLPNYSYMVGTGDYVGYVYFSTAINGTCLSNVEVASMNLPIVNAETLLIETYVEPSTNIQG